MSENKNQQSEEVKEGVGSAPQNENESEQANPVSDSEVKKAYLEEKLEQVNDLKKNAANLFGFVDRIACINYCDKLAAIIAKRIKALG